MSFLKDHQLKEYHRDGFYCARKMFSAEEIQLLRDSAHRDRALDLASTSKDDGQGNAVRISLWNHPGDGIYGAFARCRRVVDSVEAILDDEAYHYHSKMILKDAKVGGAWAWHQDYGYWYQNGVLFPDLCSVMIAVDAATKENGCLQVIKGSHKLGRVNHQLTGDQAGADMERVNEALKRLELVHCEMEPGDVLFFHANLLHASAANRSDNSRWSMICCYNAKHNDPYKKSHHPNYTKLHKLDDAKVLEIGRAGEEESGSVQFADLNASDTSARSLAEEASNTR